MSKPLQSITFPGLDEQYLVAPGGYGLGEYAVSKTPLTDANSATLSGLYFINNTTANGINVSATLEVIGYSYNFVVQTAYPESSSDIKRRQCINGTWSDWESINPPMTLWEEYRTIEKWQGHVVYTRLVDCGALPNNTRKAIGNGTGATRILRIAGSRSDGEMLPVYYDGREIVLYSSKTHIHITTNYDFSQFTAIVQLWYIKD